MITGETIYSNKSDTTYTVTYAFKAGGQSEVCFAKSNKSDKVFFIKRLLCIKYSEKKNIKLKCDLFEKERFEIYCKINRNILPGASCSYIYDFFHDAHFYYVVTERINGFVLIPSIMSKGFSIEDKLFLFRIIIHSYLPFEKEDIVHADLKPDNIIIKFTKNRCIPKLIDFESAFLVSSPPKRGYIVGTEPYYSPEIGLYNNEKLNFNGIITTKSDIFSLGVIFYEILTGHLPQISEYKMYTYELVNLGLKIPLPSYWSERLKKLISCMLDKDPQIRPNTSEILDTLKDLDDVSLSSHDIEEPIILVNRISLNRAQIVIHSINKEANIYYSLDNSPFYKYIDQFFIEDDDTLLKIKIEMHASGKTETKYFNKILNISKYKTKKVSRPIININNTEVNITCKTENASIFYTLDGSTPSKYSTRYSTPFKMTSNISIIKAISRHIGMYDSDISSLNRNSKIKIS